MPGGFEEATLTSNSEQRIYIKSRKGFIKYALKYGYTIYPSYIFGETRNYWVLDKFLKFRLLFNKLKFPGVIFCSKCVLLPDFCNEMHTVIGKGIHCP